MKKKIVSIVMCSAMAAAMLAGCGSSSSSTSASTTADTTAAATTEAAADTASTEAAADTASTEASTDEISDARVYLLNFKPETDCDATFYTWSLPTHCFRRLQASPRAHGDVFLFPKHLTAR